MIFYPAGDQTICSRDKIIEREDLTLYLSVSSVRIERLLYLYLFVFES